jgi:hypothetical protein
MGTCRPSSRPRHPAAITSPDQAQQRPSHGDFNAIARLLVSLEVSTARFGPIARSHRVNVLGGAGL